MATEYKCPYCGKPVPTTALQGICPECMLRAGLAETGEVGPDGDVAANPSQPAPRVEEIAPHFPQLEILECLGRGGMGAVYKARQPKLDRFVALKILTRHRGRGITDTEFAARFQQEARALARLNHPGIVAVYDFGEAGGLHYLLMEYVDGLTLRQLLQTRKLAPEAALAIVPKICEALQFAHERGIVHRDIKPENILLDKAGQVKIADFGIAKIINPLTWPAATLSPSDGERDGVRGESLTQNQVLGTPHYMAPEQVEKPATVDHRADIFSLGVVFYEMLTGELPLGKFQPPSKKVPVDVRLDEVVLHALEKEPDRRYQHASEVKAAVETIAATPAASATTAGKPAAMFSKKRWRDLWLWDPEYRALFVMGPVVGAGILVLILWPHWGSKALWLFAFELVGVGLTVTYAWVFHRIQRLGAALPRATGEVAEGLMFWRLFQSPGLAVLHEDRLELIPILRAPVAVALGNIVAVNEVRWFNGMRLWSKRGFALELANGQRVGLAVADPVARRWRARLSRGRLPELPPDPAANQSALNEAEWENPRNWTGPKWLSVYFSKRDSRVWVPKQIPALGWTVNLGSRKGAAWLLGIFFSILGILAVAVVFVMPPAKGHSETPAAVAVMAREVPPVVIATIPESGTTGVDPALTELRVTFSKPMQDGSWSWTIWGEDSFPEQAGQPRFLADGRTCVLPVKLKPGKLYATWLNSDYHQDFKDRIGQSALPYLLVFETRK